MFDYYLTADDVLASSVDNMSDEEIDRDVKLFRRIAQKLGIRNYNDLIVVPGEDDYNPDYYEQPLGIFSTNLYKNNDSIKVYSVNGIDFVAEELNGTLYLYFKDETTASKYKDMVDEFNNSYSEGINESLNEELDSDEWEEIASKQVIDFDGFWTDYTLYYNESEGRFVCIFGDKQLYDPTNAEPDFECEEKWEAFEWFEDYDTGAMDGEDDTIYESKKPINENLDSIEDDPDFMKFLEYLLDKFVQTYPGDFYVESADIHHFGLEDKPWLTIGISDDNGTYYASVVLDSNCKSIEDLYQYSSKILDSWKREYIRNDSEIDENLALNESLAQYYKIGDRGNELVYVVSAIRYSNETNSSDPYAAVYMTLVCGWDYCSDWSDKMGWVDQENWVEDVQTDYFIAYLSDESVAQAIEDNGYTPTEKPSPIYHYNEEKDRWEVLKESLSVDKYIRESLNELDNKAINEDTKFYDLRSLYEAFSNKLTSEQKQELKKVIDSTDDAEIIAAAIETKTKNEAFDIDTPENNYSVSAFLTKKGYQNYVGLYEDLWTNDLSEAEAFIWDSLQNGLYVEFNDYTALATKGYTDTKYYSPDKLDETTVDYKELEECVFSKELNEDSNEKFTPINKQMKTERGLVYVSGSYPSKDAAREAGYDYAFHSRDLGKDLFSKITKDINHREFVIIDESLTEKLVDPSEEIRDEFLSILNKHGFELDKDYKYENPSKNLLGGWHYQVINPNLIFKDNSRLRKELIPLIDELHEFEERVDCPITWSFGANKDNVITAGLDISEQWIPDEEPLT